MSEHIYTRIDVETRFKAIKGKLLGEVDTAGYIKSHIGDKVVKGCIGNAIELSVLGYEPDPKQEPDLIIDGVKTELKATGIRQKKRPVEYAAKEPMSITACSLDKIHLEVFDDSAFWHKLAHMLLLYYHYNVKSAKMVDYLNFPVIGYQFFEFNEKDKEILRADWHVVHDFVIECNTKGIDVAEGWKANSTRLRHQMTYTDTAPKYPPRFRLKASIVTYIFRHKFANDLSELPDKYEHGISDVDVKCHSLAASYVGKTVHELSSIFGVKISKKKQFAEPLIIAMFGGNATKMHNIETFQKYSCVGKAITISNRKKRTEDVKFCPINFDEFCDPNIEFEDSEVYSYFSEHQFYFVVFQEPSAKADLQKNVFLGFKRLTFDSDFLDVRLRAYWNSIRELVWNNELKDVPKINKKTGKPIWNKKSQTWSTAPNLPKSKDSMIFCRGTGTDAGRKTECVNGVRMYHQDVWVRGTDIVNMLAKEEFI